MIVVLDTDVVVAAMRSPRGASAGLLRLLRQGRLRVAVSVPLFAEYEAVCQRPHHRQAAGLTEAQVSAFLDGLASLVTPVEIHYNWRPQLRDVADEMVLEAAVNAGADALVSFNHRDFAAAAARFGLRLRLPGEVLRSLPHE
ncbi:MAG: putative toxin-antitoxin system toxin component, PIN family [Casimicrobiaceae bacterium]|nr:putative toxin-antitoxin system toxin component, PIN family [Casimicrobiaceae bacterium]MCX8098124.1 putative toxin-antitoxin system toxin component, PIN family [Casimicrobiaceae bacterium]MDW8311662.1 putative toxin-antitoxin system toxin component, PIN family [Burkholderiales bacterium]